MKTILVTAIGSFSADIVIKSLKQMGMRVIGCDIYPKEWVADAHNVHAFYQVSYASRTKEYLDAIIQICHKEKVEMIFPLTDVEVDVFNSNRDIFLNDNIIVCMSSKDTIDICRDKYALFRYITNNVGIVKTIPTIYLNDDKKFLPEVFPVVCKPYNGRSSQGLNYIRNMEEWNVFVGEHDINSFIVQPFVEGTIVTVDVVFSPKEGKGIAIPRKELLRTLNGAGTSVYVFHDEILEKKCCMLAKKLEIIGCVNFEFILDKNGEYHFVECNPRFSGGVEFSNIAGYNCISNHLNVFLGKSIQKFEMFQNYYIARKYEEYVMKME